MPAADVDAMQREAQRSASSEGKKADCYSLSDLVIYLCLLQNPNEKNY